MGCATSKPAIREPADRPVQPKPSPKPSKGTASVHKENSVGLSTPKAGKGLGVNPLSAVPNCKYEVVLCSVLHISCLHMLQHSSA